LQNAGLLFVSGVLLGYFSGGCGTAVIGVRTVLQSSYSRKTASAVDDPAEHKP